MSAIYMKIDRIDGEVSAKQYKNWIEIIHCEFSVKRLLTTDPGRIINREGTRPVISEVSVNKRADKSSPLLFSESCVGKAKHTVLINICQSNTNICPYIEITLNNVIFSGYRFLVSTMQNDSLILDNSNATYPIENICLNFDKIEIRYIPYNSLNQPESPIPAGYDLKQATTF